jgi:hypothetical protein
MSEAQSKVGGWSCRSENLTWKNLQKITNLQRLQICIQKNESNLLCVYDSLSCSFC